MWSRTEEEDIHSMHEGDVHLNLTLNMFSMSGKGRGKGAKALGKGGARRHQRVLRDNIHGCLTRGAGRRLARRGGVKRLSYSLINALRGATLEFLDRNLYTIEMITQHSKRKTIIKSDAIQGLRVNNIHVYG